MRYCVILVLFFFQAEDGIRDLTVTGVQTCALPISRRSAAGALIAVGLALAVLVIIAPAAVPAGTPGHGRVDQNTGHAASALVVLLAAWAAGRAVRAGRAYTAGLRE